MGSLVPTIHIDKNSHLRLCEELRVLPCEIVFDPQPAKSGVCVMGTYLRVGAGRGRITIHLNRRLIGRKLTMNKRKKMERDIAATLLHEYRHHWQHDHNQAMVNSSRDVDYWQKPIEVDARQFAKGALHRHGKLISISRP